ncbi:MAG: DMT family transporter [Anaerolineales bacterium]|nr:DMT family transporter [Anaerolineales bacterium]
MTPKTPLPMPVIITLMVFFDSLHFVFGRLLWPLVPPAVSSFFIMFIAAVLWTAIMGVRRTIDVAVLRQNLPFFGLLGFLLALDLVLGYASVEFVDPGTAALLARSSTIFSIGLGVFWLKERLNRPMILGTAVALLGVFVISFQPGDYFRVGSLLVLVASFAYALHTAVVKRYGEGLDIGNFFLFRLWATVPFALGMALLSGEWVVPVVGEAWLWLVVTAVVNVVISRMVYYAVLRLVTVSYHAIVLTLSTVLTVLWSWLLFGVWPTLASVVGGTAVVVGVSIVTRFRGKT